MHMYICTCTCTKHMHMHNHLTSMNHGCWMAASAVMRLEGSYVSIRESKSTPAAARRGAERRGMVN